MKHMTLRLFWSAVFTAVLMLPSCTSTTPLTVDCEELIISPIADLEVIANTRSYIPISVLASSLAHIEFTLAEDYSFINLEKTQRGRALLTVDADESNIGQYINTIQVSNGTQNACISFTISIKESDAQARIIHCDPLQNNGGDGSLEKPYPSLSKLIATGFSANQNDLILLHEGDHGDVTLSGTGYTIAAKNKHKARLSSLIIENAEDISIKGLEIRPTNDIGDHDQYLISIDSTCKAIHISHNQVINTDDATPWNQEDWNTKASRGIKCRANHCTIQNNLIQNIFHGIKTEGNNISVNFNHVDRFAGDAIRNTGSNNTYRSNFLTNATVDDYYDEKGNHDDLFQSWTFDKPIDNISLLDNVMVSCIDTLMPQRAKIVQGLVCFDGYTTHWTVANNLVVTDHPHGISLYGAENCNIHDNTVLKNPHDLYQYESDPWIMINNHKDGRKSINNQVSNNITSALSIVAEDVTVANNTIIDSTLIQKLYNYDQWDFRIEE